MTRERLPSCRSRDIARILGQNFGFEPIPSRRGSHQVWKKTLTSDSRILRPTLVLNKQYRDGALVGILNDAGVSRESFIAAFHGFKRGRNLSESTLANHPDATS